jgi:adenylosuccinate synthase
MTTDDSERDERFTQVVVTLKGLPPSTDDSVERVAMRVTEIVLNKEAGWSVQLERALTTFKDQCVLEERSAVRRGITQYVNQKFLEGIALDPLELYEALNHNPKDL